MCSLIPDQPRSSEAGLQSGCRRCERGCLSPQPEGWERGGARWGEGRAVVLWLSSNDGAQGGSFAYLKELRGAMIELIVQSASTSVESGLDLFEALK